MVPISPEIYSGAAVTFDNRSLFDFQQRLEDRRMKQQMAEQEAIEKFLKDTEKDLSTKGIRQADIPRFTEKITEYRNLSNEYKKQPRNLEKKIQLMNAAENLSSFVQKSKDTKEEEKQGYSTLRQIRTNKGLRETFDLERFMSDFDKLRLPLEFKGVPMLGIPERPDDVSINLDYYKPATPNTFNLVEDYSKGVDFDATVKKTKPDAQGYYEEVLGFDPKGNSVKTVLDKIKYSVLSNPDLQSSYKVYGNVIDSARAAQLNASLQKVYPELELDVNDGTLLAMAEAADQMLNKTKVLQRRTRAPKGGGGAGKPKEESGGVSWFNQMKKAIASNDVTKIDDVARDLLGGGKFSNMTYSGTKITYTGVSNEGTPIEASFDLTDPNIDVRLSSVYQRAMGEDKELEQLRTKKRGAGGL